MIYNQSYLSVLTGSEKKNPNYVKIINDELKLPPNPGIFRIFPSYHFNDFADSDAFDRKKYDK